ncbi:MAG: cytochrome c oxidase subunit II [Salinirussus sp.]
MHSGISHHALPLHAGSIRTPADIFGDIFVVFLALGTLVGVVVIAYTLYNAIKYRDHDSRKPDDGDVVRPTLGELPTGTPKGRKLAVSFTLSAVIVLSLILWTYSALLFVESGPQEEDQNELTIDVVGQRFSWEFVYPNGHSSATLRVPRNRVVELNVTSADVMHNIGIPEFGAKADAIPGQTTSTWFVPKRTGEYAAKCYELCGVGHSTMRADVIVMERDEYNEWYNSTGSEGTVAQSDAGAAAGTGDAPGDSS